MNQDLLNQIWPGWILARKLGQGSYGGVFEIERTLPGGRVERSALKRISIPRNQEEVDSLLAQSVSEESISEFYKEELQKLVKEYTMMKQLNGCENIVAVQDISYQKNGYGWDIYFRMELLQPLKRVIDTQYREMNVIRLGIEVCNALIACSSLNILHRDIKPENILVSDKGVFKLGDFGIAKASEKTQTGTVAGTFGYMAPEVANREHYGSSADIYSLGMVLYWLANNNTLPFLPLPPQIPTASQRQQALSRRFSGEQLPAPINGTAEFKEIILKACAYSPADRYHSPSELRDALRELYYRKQKQTEQIMAELGLSSDMIGQEDMPKLRSEIEAGSVHTVQENSLRDVKAKRKKVNPFLIIACVAGLAVAGVAGYYMIAGNKLQKPPVSVEAPVGELEPEEIGSVTEAKEPTVLTEAPETVPTTEAFVFAEVTEPIREANVECSYEVNGDGITVTGFYGVIPGEVVLPEEIDGLPVTKIGNHAFHSSTTVKKVWLPDTVTEIGDKAFSGCTKLQNVQFSSELNTIGQGAFENCSSLSNITLPDGLSKIGTWAFANCKRLTKIEIPGTVSSVGEWSFSGCTGLSNLTLKEGITTIDNYVFFNCQRLTEVSIPEGVKTINIGAFSGCSGLTNVTFPNSLRTLSAESFQGTALKEVYLNPNCSIGEGAVPLGCSIYNQSQT